eukprot:TRINITY_DN71169_c0_g1_i1.p1 TRINITY_DN71169_c0_g1~~TRINITY_DN71169_c0_g1_i1.p1  ORF type:complete len:198 (-),score=35.57 TRINITY_DN71169_c0_g1_i1:58-651(-)
MSGDIDEGFSSTCCLVLFFVPFATATIWIVPWIASVLPVMGIVIPLACCFGSVTGCLVLPFLKGKRLARGSTVFPSVTADVEGQIIDPLAQPVGQPGELADELHVDSFSSKQDSAPNGSAQNAEGVPGDAHGARFQVLIGSDWQDFGEPEQTVLREALLKGEDRAVIQARGQNYEVIFSESVQRNLSTRKEREIRIT